MSPTQPSRRLLAAALMPCLVAGCQASFDMPLSELPHLDHGGQLRQVDGTVQEAPKSYFANVVTRPRAGHRLMVPVKGDQAVIATPVAAARVSVARRQGWTDGPFYLGWPVKAGVGRRGTGLAASRDDRLPPAAPDTPPVFWFRDNQGRVVELDLAYVSHIHVEEKGSGGGNGASIAIVVGSIVGGLLLIGGIVGIASFAHDYSKQK